MAMRGMLEAATAVWMRWAVGDVWMLLIVGIASIVFGILLLGLAFQRRKLIAF